MKKLTIRVDGYVFDVTLNLLPPNGSGITVQVDGQSVHVHTPDPATSLGEVEWYIVDGRPIELSFDEELAWVETRWGTFPLQVEDQARVINRPQTSDGRVKAPIPGQVTHVMVREGDIVHTGQSLLILEAMKMENEIRAPRKGKITLMNVEAGKSVTLNELLLEIE